MSDTSPSYSGSVNATTWLLWNRLLGVVTKPGGGLISAPIENTANMLFYRSSNGGVAGAGTPPTNPPSTSQAGASQVLPNQQVGGDGLAYTFDVYVAAVSGTQQVTLDDLTGDIPVGLQWIPEQSPQSFQPLPTNYTGAAPHTIQGKVAVAATANQLTGAPNYILQTGLTLKASQNNGATGMTVGFTNALTDVADGTGNGAIVYPGEPLWIPPGVNLNSIWINSATALDIVYGLGS